MKKMIRSLFLIFIILSIYINTYAEISDNDGSAFITKAEFDALKSSFQSQIDTYNQSIDSKIDSAIASYLAGIAVTSERDGENLIRSMNNSRQVRFYNYSSNTFHTSTIAKLRINYLWRLFGNYNPMTTDQNAWDNKYMNGSFLLNLFGKTHDRGFLMSAKGDTTNYQYQTTKYSYSGDTYYALDDTQTKTFTCTVGAYYNSYFHTSTDGVLWGSYTIPTTFDYTTRQIEIPYKTNTIEPKTITHDMKYKVVTLNGAEWNIWRKDDNGVDCDFVYDFTNTTYNENTDILAYEINDFNNWTVQDTIANSGTNWGVDGDFWLSFIGDGGNYYRTYAYLGTNTNDVNITGSQEKTKYNSLKYYRPKIDSIKTGKLIHGVASAQLDKPVKPYNGAPFTKMMKNAKKMTAKINVKIYDSTNTLIPNAPYHILLRNKAFDNTNSSTYVSSSDSTIKKWNVSSGSANYDIELNEAYLSTMNEGDVMYMRVMPTTAGYHADIYCSEIKFSIEE